MKKQFRLVVLWVIGSALTVLVTMATLPAAFVDGHYIPSGDDSFYHAHRILTTARDLSAFYEFDPKIHVPEGSLLTWPWGYDYAMALLVKAGIATGLSNDPVKMLDYIPVAATLISAALMLGIGVGVGLGEWGLALALICLAFSPLTQILHGVGCVDHHFAEYLFVLGALLSGMVYLKTPDSRARAVVAGLVLGSAPAVHNALFIVQIPLLVSLGLLWLRDVRMPRASTLWFGAALLVATLLVLLPSQPFRHGQFEFYLLSWFHLYAAACTAIIAVLLSRLPRSNHSMAIIAGIAFVMLLPFAGQLLLGKRFVSGQIELLDKIEEAKSAAAMVRTGGLYSVLKLYSGLILLVPLTLAGCAWMIIKRQPAPPMLHFFVSSFLGLLLLLAQFRFHNYGSYALFLPLLLAAQHLLQSRPALRTAGMGLLTIGILLAYAPPIRSQLFIPWSPGNDFYYGLTRSMYPTMAQACSTRPGTVLAANDDGHYISYHTACSVIANNFLLTELHEEKVREARRLLNLTPQQLLESGASVQYVFARFTSLFTRGADGKPVVSSRDELQRSNNKLVSTLLLSEPASLGQRYHLLKELRFPGDDGFAYARLFEIR